MVGAVQDQQKQHLSSATFLEKVLTLPGTRQNFQTRYPLPQDARESIYQKDVAPADIYIVIEGMVGLEGSSLFGKRVIYDFRGKGELFGDTHGYGYYPDSAYPAGSATVKRLEPSVFIASGLGNYIDLTNRESDKNLRECREDMAAGCTTDFRTARALLRFSRKFEAICQDQNNPSRISLPFTHEELAGYVGASRESISKAIREMRRARVVRCKRRSISFSITAMEEYVLSLEDLLV